jgi:hypothetical protein
VGGCDQNTTDRAVGGDASPNAESDPAIKATAQTKAHIPHACGEGGLALRDVVAVNGSYELRANPASDSAKIKNQKASDIFEKDHFHSIDGSTTVSRLCVQSEWTRVQIRTPDWLTHVKGWVPNEALREIERTASGSRQYVEEDFLWDKNTSGRKEQLVAAVNKIASQNKNCKHIDTASLARSSSRSKPGAPVFFITCGKLPNVLNVFFKPEDATSAKRFVAKEPLGKTAAADACEVAAKQAANHPSTVDFSRVWDLAYRSHMSGRARVVSSFTAKNSLNLELKYRIDCLFDGSEMIEVNISEAR